MALPLQKTIFITVLVAGFTMASLLLLGVRQAQLAKNHGEIATKTEKVVFQFAIIREHLTDILLEKQYGKLTRVAADLEELNANLAKVLSYKEISEEYKLSLFSAVDLPGVILLMRKMGSAPVAPEQLRQLNSDIRAINERLLLFDRVLVGSAKTRLIKLQNIVIGTMALVLSQLVVMLLWLRRQLVAPLVQLSLQSEQALAADGDLAPLVKGGAEIRKMGSVVAELLSSRRRVFEETERYLQMTGMMKRVQQAMLGATDRQTLFRDVCRALLHNPDYCLVWVGEPDRQGASLEPVSADGSTTMSKKESDTCLAVLLTEAEEKGEGHSPAMQALRSRKPVVARDILAGIPKGLLKGTPLVDSDAACAALPLQWQGSLYGVLSIYALSRKNFADRELDLLQVLAGGVAGAVAALKMQQQAAAHQSLGRQLQEAMGAAVIVVAADGRIVELNEVASRFSGYSTAELAGKRWDELVRIPDREGQPLDGGAPWLAWHSGGQNRKSTPVFLVGKNEEWPVRCHVFQVPGPVKSDFSYWCVAFVQNGMEHAMAPMHCMRASRLAVLGEVATGVAHEISDLSNGMINYAQVLADEAAAEAPQSVMLQNIISAGEHIAELVKKLIFYGQEGQPEEYLPLAQVLGDAIALGGYHMRNDGILLEVSMPQGFPALPVNAHQLQQVFLNIINNARRALNMRYPGKHANKKFRVEGQMITAGAREKARLLFTDQGAGIEARLLDKLFEPGHPLQDAAGGAGKGLCRSREIVSRHGGVLTVESTAGEYTRVIIDLPLVGSSAHA